METSKKAQPNRIALTLAKARDAKPPERGDYTLWDATTRGLGLRVYSTGAKAWIAQRKLNGRPVRRHLGHFPDMTLEKARNEAEEVLAKIRKGIDPNLERRQQARETEKARDREKLTMGFVFGEYISWAKGTPESPQDGDEPIARPNGSASTIRDLENAKRRLEGGDLWGLPLEAIDEQALHKEFQRLCLKANPKKSRNGGRTAAGGVLRYARAAFNRAASEYHLKLENPFKALNKKEPGWQTAPARDRIVADAEGDLARWWKAVEALRGKTDGRARDAATIADWLQVALLLGGRKTESLSLKWEDVDFERGVGVFRKTKRGKEHFFPLAPYVRGILERRKKANDESSKPSEYVFPASRAGWKSKERTCWRVMKIPHFS